MIKKLKTLFFYPFFIFIFSTSSAQTEGSLSLADSLFVKTKYTEAFAIYTTVFSSSKATESMLLKMAFIKEGLGDYVQSLYYLDQYYNLTFDKSVLIKMQELANENSLKGYDFEDKDFFLNFLHFHWIEIQLGLVAISIFLLAFIYQSRKRKRMPMGMPVLQLIVLAVFLILSNNWVEKDTAIITSPTLLMSGPSAGAEPVGWVNEGHKVDVIDESDVWTKIQWETNDAYIRNSKLQLISSQ